MKITIYYDRLFDDGSLIDRDIILALHDKWDISIIPDVIAKLYKSMDNQGISIKIQIIKIER